MNVLRNMPIDQVSQLLLDAPDLSLPADLHSKVQQWCHLQNSSNNRIPNAQNADFESSSSSGSSSSSSDSEEAGFGKREERRRKRRKRQ